MDSQSFQRPIGWLIILYELWYLIELRSEIYINQNLDTLFEKLLFSVKKIFQLLSESTNLSIIIISDRMMVLMQIRVSSRLCQLIKGITSFKLVEKFINSRTCPNYLINSKHDNTQFFWNIFVLPKQYQADCLWSVISLHLVTMDCTIFSYQYVLVYILFKLVG